MRHVKRLVVAVVFATGALIVINNTLVMLGR